jgi:hypothetical protein
MPKETVQGVGIWPRQRAQAVITHSEQYCRAAEDNRAGILVENASLASSLFQEFGGYERQCTVSVIST